MERPQHIVLTEGGPPAKRRRCHFLEEEESNAPVKGQLDGSSSRSKFDSDEEVEGSSASDDDSNENIITEIESEEPSLNWLPCEVLEVVFCQLPLVVLFMCCRLVCRSWNDIIMREKFLKWKKQYHMVKSGCCLPVSTAIHHIEQLVQTSHTSCLINMAMFVGKEFVSVTVEEGVEERILGVLRAHPQYSCVERIAEIHPQLKEGKETLGVIQSLTLLVVCCHSVDQVLSLLISLCKNGGGGKFGIPVCSRITVMEIFYCLACLCYSLWNEHLLPQRFHYFIYYSLNVLERGPSAVPCSQLSGSRLRGQSRIDRYFQSSLQLTTEQCKIINHPMRLGETIQVKAFAGTGKTTVLPRLAALNPNWKFLYCMYNKKKYRFKFLYDLNPKIISEWIVDVPGYIQKSRFTFSKFVRKALLNFFASDSQEVTGHHLKIDIFFDADCPDLYEDTENYAAAVLRETRRIWEEMKNLKNEKIGMTHDGYLKLYQLQKPQINDYDCILVDEAQDLTPAIISIIKAQECAKVLVGDPHQQIYGFRGAMDAMAFIHADHNFHLTRSFRFGPEIAYTASCILEVLKGVRRQTIVGGLQPGGIHGEQSGQLAIIARYNDTLFVEMACVVESGQQLRFWLAGGIKGYDFDVYLDIHKLMNGKRDSISNSLVKKFLKSETPYHSLKTYAECSDASLFQKIKICERFSRDLPAIISKIQRMTSNDKSKADIVFSTAHKSKGLEFNAVKLTDDYLESHDNFARSNSFSSLRPDERNLLYVAATRAKKQLIISETLLDVLHRAKEFFVYPSACQEAQLSVVVCAVCELSLPPPRLSLERKQIQLTNNSQPQRGGFICKSCSSTVLPCFEACF